MSHFKYEIDERSLRLQLKELEVPFSEEAWQKFENYSSTHTGSMSGESAVKRFQISLNRNVVLPAVFGSVIVLFSLLLFNFVNIKNPNPARVEKAEPQPEPAGEKPEPVVKKDPQPAAPAKQEMVARPAEAPAVAETQNTAPAQETVKTEPQPAAGSEVKETPAAAIRITKAKDTVLGNGETQTIKTEVRPRKRNKKRAEVATEPIAGEEEQAPPPATETPGE